VQNAKSNKNFYAMGLQNEDEGFELRNQFFKGCVGSKAITFIRGTKIFPEEVHIFEAWSDFLSALAYCKVSQFEGDSIILNSTSLLKHAYVYIKNYSYKYVLSWMDNDKTGAKATQTLLEFAKENGLTLKAMNPLFAKHKDVNSWHMNKLGLKQCYLNTSKFK
jgi:hypothetical protein